MCAMGGAPAVEGRRAWIESPALHHLSAETLEKPPRALDFSSLQ